ncbi:MAG TPA: hypothetical protein VIW70_12635 [Rubrivivax sp.]
MRVAGCVMAVLAGVAMSATAQNFVNLDFDHPLVPDPFATEFSVPWEVGAPGWGHGVGENSDFLTPVVHLGVSQTYALSGSARGRFHLSMRAGTFSEQDPDGPIVDAYIWQTGRIGPHVTTLSLLSSTNLFGLGLGGQRIDMRPVGLDPASPTYAEDVTTYVGEWIGDVSAFAGQVVTLTIRDESWYDMGPYYSPTGVAVDEIRFLPVPEMSTASLFGPGLFAVLLAAKWSARGRRHRWPGQGR